MQHKQPVAVAQESGGFHQAIAAEANAIAIERVDLLVGTMAEAQRPTCYGFGETLFQVFLVMATRRLHGPAERRLMITGAMILAALGAASIVWPKSVAWPFGLFSVWMGLALLARALRRRTRAAAPEVPAIRSREERT